MNRVFSLIACIVLSTAGLSAQSNRNYVKAIKRGTNGGMLSTYQYYDAGGRPCETAEIGVTPGNANLLTLTEYDGLGRESRQWSPLPTSMPEMSAGALGQAAQSYYSDSRPYTEKAYEATPLNRLSMTKGIGQSWTNHSQQVVRLHNTDSYPLSCTDYRSTISGQLMVNGSFAPHVLSVTKQTDEDGRNTYEFRDKQGRIVLQRSMLTSGSSADTYYVYDNRGDLRLVLQPGYQSEADLDKFAFQYTYDARHNVITKKMPGAAEIRYSYDKANRLAFSQDGCQRTANRMSFMLYDQHSRLLLKGSCDCTDFSAAHTDNAVASLNPSVTGICATGYSSSATLSGAVLEQAFYYDNYQCLQLAGFSGKGFTPASVSARGQQTATITNTFGMDSVLLYSVTHYDIKGRVTMVMSTNHLGGMETVTTEYGYIKPVRVTQVHTAPHKATVTQVFCYTYDHADRLLTTTYQLNAGNEITLQQNTYDELGRLNTKNLGGSLTTSYTYNIRSWTKSISSGTLFNESLYYNENYLGNTPQFGGNVSAMSWRTDSKPRAFKFSYDGLSRLTQANYMENSTASNHYTELFRYDVMGNVESVVRWGLQDDNQYGLIDDLAYTYNGNQLVKVEDFADGPNYAGAFHFVDGADEDIEYEYDQNGNMTKDLNRKISSVQYNLLNLPSMINYTDDTSQKYVYDAAGHKLQTRHAVSVPLVPFPDNPILHGLNGIHTMGGGIAQPSHPIDPGQFEELTFGVTTTDYCGNIIYQNGVCVVLIPDGYVTFSGSTPQYHYYLKDHLGNVRVVVSESGSVEQVNHYYAFGGLMGESTGGDTQRFKYNGKELDRMSGLDWYDYGARHYDAMRFTTMDPLAEKYYGISPYAYCANNPINAIDPDGKEIWIYYVDEQGNQQSFQYSINMKCEINNSVAQTFVNLLNTMSSNEDGRKIINAIVNSETKYGYTQANTKNEEGEGFFDYRTNKTSIDDVQNTLAFAEETFHIYQNVNKQGGKTAVNEVEAKLFSAKMNYEISEWNNSLYLNNLGGQVGSPYTDSMIELFWIGYSDKAFNTAVNNFFSGSYSGSIYKNKLGYRRGTIKRIPLIKQFLPVK